MSQHHTIAGHVGGEIQVRQVEVNGETRVVGSFSVAINNRFNREAPPTWYRVSVWNGLAGVVGQYVHKGDYVVVTGERLTASSWLDREGNARATLELTADNVDFSANKAGNGNPEAVDSDDNAPPPRDPGDVPF